MIRIGQDWSGLFGIGWYRLGEVMSGHEGSGQVDTGKIRKRQVGTG